MPHNRSTITSEPCRSRRSIAPDPNSCAQLSTLTANPQSRYQVTDVVANQTEVTYKFDTGGFKHTLLTGVELDRETASIDKYAGLTSEGAGGAFTGSGSLAGVNVFTPEATFLPFGSTPLLGMPTKLAIDTAAVYALDTVNYNDVVILNGGIRYDDYRINTSGYGTVNGTQHIWLTGCRIWVAEL